MKMKPGSDSNVKDETTYPCERSLGNKITDLICLTQRLNNTEGIILRTEHLFVFFVIQEEKSRLSYLNRVTEAF